MASCFSEYELTRVASKSSTSESPGGAAAHTLARAAAMRLGDGPELEGRRRLDGPPGGGDRSHRTEQLGLFTQGRHVGQTVGTVGDGHGQMGEDHARDRGCAS